MKGFKIDKKGSPLNAVEWEPEVTELDADGKETTVKVPQPKDTVFPENFDEVLAGMTAPAESRLKPVFSGNAKATFLADDSPAVKLQVARNKKRKEEDAEWSKA